MLLQALARNWWVLALRGVIALIFAILALSYPVGAILSLVLLFAIYALIDGVCAFVAWTSARDHWVLLLEAVVGVLAGVLTFFWPGITALALAYLIAFWAIAIGIFQIGVGIRLRKVVTNEWMYVLRGILSILFGVLVLMAPGFVVITWIATFAILFGVLMLVGAFRLRALGHDVSGAHPLPS